MTGSVQNRNDNECLAARMEVEISRKNTSRAPFSVITVMCTFAGEKWPPKKGCNPQFYNTEGADCGLEHHLKKGTFVGKRQLMW